MLDDVPYKLELSISRDLQLKVSLKNISKSTQLVFIHACEQPCYFEFRDETGKEASPGARRVLPGYYRQPLQLESYQEVPPKRSILFATTQFRTSGKKYVLDLFEQQYEFELGRYRVEANWASRLNAYVDDNGERKILPGVWQGIVRSSEIKFQLREI